METPKQCPKGHTTIRSGGWFWTCPECNWILDKAIEKTNWQNAERGYEAARRTMRTLAVELPEWEELDRDSQLAAVDFWAGRG